MFEQINNMENKTQEYNFPEDKNINIIIQYIVEGYLKRKQGTSMRELLQSEGIEDKAGVIYNYHIAFLQCMIAEELLTIGVNVAEEVLKRGEQYQLGKLSEFESPYVDNIIANTAGLIEVIKEKISK